jgi:hypothetical protein
LLSTRTNLVLFKDVRSIISFSLDVFGGHHEKILSKEIAVSFRRKPRSAIQVGDERAGVLDSEGESTTSGATDQRNGKHDSHRLFI